MPANRRQWLLGLAAWTAGARAQSLEPQPALADEAQRDQQAFGGVSEHIRDRAPDVQSVVVLLQGRTAFAFHRDGDPAALRDTQSVSKSALAALVGAAMLRGRIGSLDQPAVELVPEWRAANPDPRSAGITLRHLLSMTAGFEVNDAGGTAPPLRAAEAWARPLRGEPGRDFAYDNSIVNVLAALLERATGQPLAGFAREVLVRPMAMAEPQYRPALRLRTADMAKLGQLFLQDGLWQGERLMPAGFAATATRPNSRGGPPVQMPYGLAWWVPSPTTYFASGYGGQYVWVHPPMDLVVATTSSVTPGSHQRGQALALLRGMLFEAAGRRRAAGR